ncbi:nucleoporin Nup186/Nup192/Nup205 [Multifurca ochricompacta]|uniref:Nucleoporin Nup186/Nup192/Nup205 n=1 Tax=Multifurca ochricompacta TaxID=376703 RepID=A0AAD4LZR1_9AGAM|nr:nucleoporin Nup186/Nup192/Nup205 [Multifurca ochricompacta]
MQSLTRLRSVLLATLEPQSSIDEQELFDLLISHRRDLVNLFDMGSPSEQEKKELQTGASFRTIPFRESKCTVGGRTISVNNDFATQVIYISQVLSCSQRYVAGLMQSVISNNPNFTPVNILEEVVLEHHRRRRDLVDCIRFLLEAAEMASSPGTTPLYARLNLFVLQQFIQPNGADVVVFGQKGLAWKVWLETETLDRTISQAQASKQNAGSSTTLQGTNINLGSDTHSVRVESLTQERFALATILFLTARLGYLSPYEIEKMVPWLQENPRHPISYYVLCSLLAAFDLVDPGSPGGTLRQKLATFPSILNLMKLKLSPTEEWKEAGIKATVQLKWTLFLTEARHRDASLEHKDGFKTEELETNIWNAVQGNAFTFLAGSVAKLRRREGSFPPGSYAASIIRFSEADQLQPLPADDFKPAIFQCFEMLVRSVISYASSELRKIKQRQEDIILASTRQERSRHFRSSTTRPEPERSTQPPRNDIAMLFSFIGILFSALPPERALQFWGSAPYESQRPSWLEVSEAQAGKLPVFLQWAVWSTHLRDLDMSIALYDMLAGLAKGHQCSDLTYNFLARSSSEVISGSVLPAASSSGAIAPWATIFTILDSWSMASNNPRSQQTATSHPGFMTSHQTQHHAQQSPLTQRDVLLGQCFLRLLATVAKYSVSARLAISGHAHLRAIPTLVSLIPLSVPLELKGAVFSALAAFCEAGAGPPGVEICRAVWLLMERLEVINVRGGGGIAKKGVQAELELVEEPSRVYPETIPFLQLLATLIHTPKQLSLKSRVIDAEPINTIPETLGQPYRQAGVDPFVAFVVDEVFLRIPTREFQDNRERWQMNDLCLAFIEGCLASYNVEIFMTLPEENQIRKEALRLLIMHPGYGVLQRILTTSPLQAGLLSYLIDGIQGFDQGLDDEEPLFRSTIIRILRIVHRVLEVQDVFLDVLVPLLVNIPSVAHIAQPRSFYTRFDQALSFSSNYVPAIAAYVAYRSHPEVSLLSVKILNLLTRSSAFSSLAILLEHSPDSERIIDGYRQLLDTETLCALDAAECDEDKFTGAGALESDIIASGLPQAVRIAVLDLLAQNTRPGAPYPNVAHFLLLGATNVQQIQDPHALGAQRTSIHVILDWVNIGIPRTHRNKNDRDLVAYAEPLFSTIPPLAERFYRVLHNLCMHRYTSDFTMRYLRTREDFFVRQLAALPFKPPSFSVPNVEVSYPDGSRVATTIDSLTSFLQLRSYIFDLVALDLHTLTNRGHFKSVSELLELIYGNEQRQLEDEDLSDEIFQPFRAIGQSNLRIIEYVQSLFFGWADALSVNSVELQLLDKLNLTSCVLLDDKGCEVIEEAAVLSLLAGARHALYVQGQIVTPIDVERLNAETAYVLESCAVENHQRKVLFATTTSFESWRRLVDMTLVKCFTRLPRDRRETMLSDLLQELPPIIRSENVTESTAILLSEVSLSLITKLREDWRSQQLLGLGLHSGPLSSERLACSRNLYAALVNYFHLVIDGPGSTFVESRTSTSMALYFSSSTTRDESLQGSLAVALPPQTGRPTSTTSTGCLAVLKPVSERLVAAVSRDATDGTEVWKTVAYMLLDCLVDLSQGDKQATILSTLVRHGFLGVFVQDIKDSDRRLQSVLKPDPDDLNSLYIYEAKMSLLIRIAQTRQGAERLIEARVLPILADCDFLTHSPKWTSHLSDHFLPSAIQRYHQLFMPALQLINAILATLGSGHSFAINQALEFLSSHRDTVIMILRNDADEISSSAEVGTGNSGYGGVHTAILSLAARCFGTAQWSQKVRPQTESERLDASSAALGAGHFDMILQRKEQLLRKALIAYLGAASEFTEPVITVVLSPMIVVPRHEDRASRFIATVPTVGDVIEALTDLCDELVETLKQMAVINAELDARDHVQVEDVRQIVSLQDVDTLGDLDIGQKRALIFRELGRTLDRTRRTADIVLSSMEMVLLLLWRHITYYCESRHIDNLNLKVSTTAVLRSVAQPSGGEAFREEAARRLSHTLHRLSLLNLVSSYYAKSASSHIIAEQDHKWRESQAYIEIMSRRIREMVGLNVENEEVNGITV